MRKCSKCQIQKELAEFYKKHKTVDSLCKDCRKKHVQAWVNNNRDKKRTNHAKWKKANPDKVKASNLKYRLNNKEALNVLGREYQAKHRSRPSTRMASGKFNAKVRGFNWEIPLDMYTTLLQNSCYYCSDRLGCVKTECGAGLDRLDNSKGYILNNIVPCCGFCNVFRNDYLSPNETQVMIDTLCTLRNIKKVA